LIAVERIMGGKEEEISNKMSFQQTVSQELKLLN
jgi:hypothetical protein